MSPPDAVRWHRHGWNSDLSWRCMLAVVPRVPSFLRPALQSATTLLCYGAMGHERRAAMRNLRRVTGRRGIAVRLAALRLFYNFSRFMVAYADMPPHGRSRASARVSGREEAESLIRSELERGHGLILLGAHLGQWDAALIDLAKSGRKVHVIMRREEESAARFAEAARRAAGLRIVHASEDAFMLVDLLAALRRGEIVAAQGDREYGTRLERVTLFGGEARIPSGPLQLARLSGASILPAAWILEPGGGYRIVTEAPLRPEATAGVAAAACAAAMERLIGAHPEQWFNFYDLWEERRETAAPPGSAGKAA